MYYNKLSRQIVFDSLDLFLIALIIASKTVSYYKEQRSEKAKIQKLKADLIKKSKLIDSSQNISYSKNTKKIKRIYKFALDQRGGGEIEDIELVNQFNRKFRISIFIQNMVQRTLGFLMTKEKNAKFLKLFFMAARLGIEYILIKCNIRIQYIGPNEINPQFAICAVCTGGTMGFVHGWFASGRLLFVTPAAITAFILRSFYQQIIHNRQYRQLLELSYRLTQDKEFRERLITALNEAIKHIEIRINNLKLDNLNWNKNTDIKQTAEQLGIFENPINIDGPLNLDTLDVSLELEQILENVGLLQKSKTSSIEEVNEFLKSNLELNPTTVKFNDVKEIITDNLANDDEIEIS